MTRNQHFLVLVFVALGPGLTAADADHERPYRTALEQCEKSRCDELPMLLSRVGRLEYLKSHYSEALTLLERSVSLDGSVRAMNSLAETLLELGDTPRAESLARRAVAQSEDSLDRSHSLGVLGGVLEARGKLAEASSALEDALRLVRGQQPVNRVAVAEALSNLGMVEHKRGHVAVAEKLYEEGVAQLRGVVAPGVMAVLMNNLASTLAAQNKMKDALRLQGQALAGWEQLYGSNHPNVASALSSMAAIEIRRKHLKEAGRYLDRAWSIDQASFPPGHIRIAADLRNRAAFASAGKRHPEAVQFLEQALRVYEEQLPANHQEVGKTWVTLGSTYAVLGQWENAEKSYRRGLDVLQAAWGADDLRLLTWLEGYAKVLREEEDYAEAGKREMQAMRIRVTNTLQPRP